MTSFNNLFNSQDDDEDRAKNSNPLSSSSMIPRNRKLSDPSAYNNSNSNNDSSSINIEQDDILDNHQSPNNSRNDIQHLYFESSSNSMSLNESNEKDIDENNNNNNNTATTNIKDNLLNNFINNNKSQFGNSSDNSFTNTNINKKKTRISNRNLMFWVSLILTITQVLGIFMFSQGFFPRKTSLQGYNSFDNYENSCTDGNIQVEPQFGKMVFMVVDAFRSSFLFGEDQLGMNFTRSLIDSGRAHAYIARADAPTVTLPRVKALVSGGIPSFVDFINNFNSKTLTDDNLLHQLKNSNRSMLFFGDDTWLKLFPDHFKRFDGTTSFYVADTVEVDNNVTRHLNELDNNDWDTMFLHYLGLDHIGHLEGPHSDLMKPKQEEMDGIIKTIHTKILERDRLEMESYKSKKLNSSDDNSNNKNNNSESKPPLPTLFVFCSDHGMNEIGNHGGSSEGETSSVLVFMSSLYYNQNDLIVDHNNNHHSNLEKTINKIQENNTNNKDESKTNNTNNNANNNTNDNTKNKNSNNSNINDNDEEFISHESVNQGRSDVHYYDQDLIPKFPKGEPPKKVDQVDLVPTLSLLLNLPIPKNSLGSLIPELFEQYLPNEQYLRALEINCQQQIEIIKHNSIFWKDGAPTNQNVANLIKLFSDAQQYHSSFTISPSHTNFNQNAADLYLEFLSKVQDQFKSLLTTFDVNLLVIGVLLIGSSALVTLLIAVSSISLGDSNSSGFSLKGIKFVIGFVLLIIIIFIVHFFTVCNNINNINNNTHNNDYRQQDNNNYEQNQAQQNSTQQKEIDNIFCKNEFRYSIFSFIFTVLCLLVGFNAFTSKSVNKLWSLPSSIQQRKEKYLIIAGTILHLISLFGSSLVEEEHLTWYFFTTTVIILQLIPHTLSFFVYLTSWISQRTNTSKQNSSSLRQLAILLTVLVCLRIFRIWNQTGIKWMDDNSLNEYTYIDFGRFLNSQTTFGTVTMWILSVISIIAPCYYSFGLLDDLRDQRSGISPILSNTYKFTIVVMSAFLFCYKWEYISKDLINPAYIARIVYLGFFTLSAITFGFPFFTKKDRLQQQQQNLASGWFITTLKFLPTLVVINFSMLFLLLHKVHNMFLITLMGTIAHFYIEHLLEDTGKRSKSGMVGVCVGILCLNWLGKFGYFAFGNSNSLASIDISGSYTALIDYNQYLVGIQTLLIGYTSQLFFFFVTIVYTTHLAIKSISSNNHQEPSLLSTPGSANDIIDEFQWYSVVGGLLDCGIRWTNVFMFSIVILIQRYHLFIWTVFSPKYIYEVLDVILVLLKIFLMAAYIIYFKFLLYIKEKAGENVLLLSSSQNINKEE
ncbi:hypothetical protein DICPUDRAFT_153293 [Dictyostelium purpureum]|uniref:GPI ethanolamine phosphate transferase 2 C-terminal domain-containing protein n=1 Tax=Dictyostelium purpureum TaxID=5786 RepID=F0ZNH7_DICPU|nr:uncharacterized protein DICPUDRAFT_153293 [Dictyostelium purpureum]EGC34499.1 hypothetical protein DICPUDRAFT_153293 [Dictyostelium purpureum]|eukprot:XP_003288988.1 hypothetical protein DICPUDRAFT_153293 [Dictyostelium purpureum]